MARLSALLTAALIAALVLVLVWARPFSSLTDAVPPVEDLAFESVRLDDAGIHAVLRAAGSEPVSIAQVQIDGAYWAFSRSGSGPVPRLGTVRLDIPYPWVEGEPVTITVLTATGATFDHVVEVAVAATAPGAAGLGQLVLIGLFVGFVPILVGFGFLPGLRALGPGARDAALGLTLGLLVFLLIDTAAEGLEFAEAASSGLHARMGFWTVALLVAGALLLIARRGGSAPDGARLAVFIALGIGFHNLGEGIAIGASITVGEVALASFLVLGFFLHNLSEAIAIAAPYRGARIGFATLFWLALLAGGPAALGTLGGAFAFTPFRAMLAFAIGAGAILQVIIELGGLLARLQGPQAGLQPSLIAGFGGGLAIMYGTSLLIAG